MVSWLIGIMAETISTLDSEILTENNVIVSRDIELVHCTGCDFTMPLEEASVDLPDILMEHYTFSTVSKRCFAESLNSDVRNMTKRMEYMSRDIAKPRTAWYRLYSRMIAFIARLCDGRQSEMVITRLAKAVVYLMSRFVFRRTGQQHRTFQEQKFSASP